MAMAMAKSEPMYRLVVFDEVDDVASARDLFVKALGLHPTDATQWIARAPGVWPKPLTAEQSRALLDGLYVLGIAAEARLADNFPELAPARTVHDAACVPEGFRVKGLRGEPTHWAPWDKVELIAAGNVAAADEYRDVSPPSWPSAALRALTFRNPHPFERKSRAQRVVRDPVGEVIIVRKEPRLAFRVVGRQMNYAYLGDHLATSASVNFRRFLSDLVARADAAYITESTRVFLGHASPDDPEPASESLPAKALFPTSQSLLDYATHRLLWSWYLKDRSEARPEPETGDDTQHD
jgi:hypothetical protein